MPCYLMRARRLPLRLRQNLQIPTDKVFENELAAELGVERHEEVAEKIESMSDEDFAALIKVLVSRRQRGTKKYLQVEGVTEEAVYIA